MGEQAGSGCVHLAVVTGIRNGEEQGKDGNDDQRLSHWHNVETVFSATTPSYSRLLRGPRLTSGKEARRMGSLPAGRGHASFRGVHASS